MTRRDGGDCYEVAGRLAIERPEVTLVHATVVGPDVPRHGHAWVEVVGFGTVLVIDKSNGHDVTLPRDYYYDLGHVQDVRRYNHAVAVSQMAKFRHFGPWE